MQRILDYNEGRLYRHDGSQRRASKALHNIHIMKTDIGEYIIAYLKLIRRVRRH